jgi:hypothetical protein
VVKKPDLLKRLQALGFPLLETEKPEDANLALADVVKSREGRLWEGFPVVLANGVVKGVFDYKKTKRYLTKPKDRSTLASLVAMSLALYEACGKKFSWAGKLLDLLSSGEKREYRAFLHALKKEGDFKLSRYTMSAQRTKTNFNNYFVDNAARLSDLLLAREELGLEYALSQVFSPKQKELFLRKLKGEKLTKTEKEYFSRTVKKKVLALSNPELHRLARRLLE